MAGTLAEFCPKLEAEAAQIQAAALANRVQTESVAVLKACLRSLSTLESVRQPVAHDAPV